MLTVAKRVETDALEAWLEYIDRVSPKTIDMGLERIQRVRAAMELRPDFPIITVGGTNGKGSTCAMLEAMLAAAGYRVGRYTSPHLLVANERIRIDGVQIGDAAFVEALRTVDDARGKTPLTYFEFGTLAAVQFFAAAEVDVAILEVGLGGRLDAVNVFDPDCAVVSSVDLDHMDYLGDTREAIAYEKAGIFRPGRAAICAEPAVPQPMVDEAKRLGADFRHIGDDFGFVAGGWTWSAWVGDTAYERLPYPALKGEYQLGNASACIAALHALRERLPVSLAAMRAGLEDVSLAGRFQVLPGTPAVVLDVAHNPHAARALAASLAKPAFAGRTHAVFAMLRDKDMAGVIRALRGRIDTWTIADLTEPRGATAVELGAHLRAEGVFNRVVACRTPAEAFVRARTLAGPEDRIVVFGSFHTVAGVMRHLGMTAD